VAGLGEVMSVYTIGSDTAPQTIGIAVDVDHSAAVRQSGKQIKLLTDQRERRP
jgi:hypothetical protein